MPSSSPLPSTPAESPPPDWLSRLQLRRPAIPLLLVGLLTVLAGAFALRLKVHTGFESLLPDSRASVKELRRVAARTTGVSTLFVILEGGEGTPVAALRRAADTLVPALKELGPPWVGNAESGVHDSLRFLQPRAGLFLELPKLEELRDDLKRRYGRAVGKATGLFVALDDTETEAPLDVATLRQRLKLEGVDPDRYPDGYYQSRDGRTVVVAVRSQVAGSDLDQGTEALQKIRAVVTRVNPASFGPGIRVGFAGDLQTGVSEYQAIHRDLTEVGLLGGLLIIAVVFLYYLRFRTLVLMLLTVGVGVTWTFGATQLLVGRLNIATGFLFTIVAGNGINFGIIYMARFLEARRRGARLEEAVAIARRETWLPTATAAAAAAASYGSLAATDFRGFHDFGLIGGTGMLLCWIATYLALPCMLAVADRAVPLERDFGGPLSWLRRLTSGGVGFGRPFAAVVRRAPRAVAVVGVLAALAGLAGAVAWIRGGPMEYDLSQLRSDQRSRAEEIRLTRLGEAVTGHIGADGMAILVDQPGQVAALRRVLEQRRDAAPAGLKPFQRLHALQDFVPAQQADKIPIVAEIGALLRRAHERGGIPEADWPQIAALLPPADLAAFALADLPDGLARAFTENDGTRGRIVYISPTDGADLDDAHYIFRWADAYREARLPDGALVRGSGRAVIYADLWAAVLADVPIAVGLSFLATLLVVVGAFRAGRASVAVLAALLVGIGWMAGILLLLKVRLNFLNFIALPITFGIGVDYAVNVTQRYVREGPGSALTAVRETGGAVILCSLTTTLGYLALARSMNFAVRSLGVAAVVGEVCCLLAAVLVLPAGLLWLDRARRRAASRAR
ncbi:MAG TPA: MMPL family transporter [Polyangia bacterium]